MSLFKKQVLFIFVFCLMYTGLTATTSPYYFLRYSQSARSAALAGAFVAMPNDAAAVCYNPASIATVKDKHFSTTFLKHVLDINSGLVSYVKNIENYGTFAGSVVYSNYGSFDYADELGNLSGSTFGSNDLAFTVSYADDLDSNLYWGASLKFIHNSIEKYSSSAMAVDIGLLYCIPNKNINIGLSILNAGTQLSTFDGTNEDLPLDVRLGINHRLKGLPLLLNFSFHHLADEEDQFFDKFLNFSIGGEFYFGKYVQVRLGYDNQIRRQTSAETNKKLSGFCGGLGIVTNSFTFDYAAAQVGASAMLHRFSLGLEF